MSLLVALHAIDHVMLAGDHRAVSVRPDGSLIPSDGDRKIRQWERGAVAGNGERWLTDAVMREFARFGETPADVLGIVPEMARQRIRHGVPAGAVHTSAWFVSGFNNGRLELHGIRFDGGQLVMEAVKPEQIEAYGSHASGKRIDRFRAIQKSIRPASSFGDAVDFMAYYVDMLSRLYRDESREDATITASFDFYVQSCLTGMGALLRHGNHLLSEDERRCPTPASIACRLPCLDHALGRSMGESEP